MLVFIDEAGDPWFKFDITQNQHSSKFFTIWMVVFDDHEEANACDQRIELLKREIWKNSGYEFHYTKDSDRVRELFFREVSLYNFFYYGIVVDKQLLQDDLFRTKDAFFKYTTWLVFENAKDKLDNAIIICDSHGWADFEQSFKKYLKLRFNEGNIKRIKNIKMQQSHKNNLLQLADYIASGVHHSLTKNKEVDIMKWISHREIHVEIRPKEKPISSLDDKPR